MAEMPDKMWLENPGRFHRLEIGGQWVGWIKADVALTALLVEKDYVRLPSKEECQVFARKHLIGFTEYQIENGKRIYRWLKENGRDT